MATKSAPESPFIAFKTGSLIGKLERRSVEITASRRSTTWASTRRAADVAATTASTAAATVCTANTGMRIWPRIVGRDIGTSLEIAVDQCNAIGRVPQALPATWGRVPRLRGNTRPPSGEIKKRHLVLSQFGKTTYGFERELVSGLLSKHRARGTLARFDDWLLIETRSVQESSCVFSGVFTPPLGIS